MTAQKTPRSPTARTRGPGRPAGGGPAAREALLDTARQLFLARGFASVTIREIARAAGTSTATIHYHFGDKLGLYRAMLEEAIAPVLEALQRLGAPEATAPVELSEVVGLYQRMLARNPWVPALIVQEVLTEGGPFRAQFIEHFAGRLAPLVVRIIAREQDRGQLRADVDPRLAALSAMSLTVFPFLALPVARRVLGLDIAGADLDTLTAHTRRVLFAGIGAPGPTP